MLDQANKFPMDAQKQIGTAYPDTKTLALIGFWRYKSIISKPEPLFNGQREIYKAKPIRRLYLSKVTSGVCFFNGVNCLYFVGGPQRMHLKGWILRHIAFIFTYYKTGK